MPGKARREAGRDKGKTFTDFIKFSIIFPASLHTENSIYYMSEICKNRKTEMFTPDIIQGNCCETNYNHHQKVKSTAVWMLMIIIH